MEVLSRNSLCAALVRCNKNPNYKAIVAFAKPEDVFVAAFDINEMHKAEPLPGVYATFWNQESSMVICFNNGSQLELITTTKNSTIGKRCNEIIYDSSINIEDIDTYNSLRCMLVPYHCGEPESLDGHTTDSDQRSQELDEFLGSFSINE